MKWGHLPGRAAAHGKWSDGMVRAEDACWRRHKMCGEAGVSALRFHLCNLLSIVQDYYQLFNNSGDIYQGQLCRAVSCRENGLSVILLHSQAGNERLFNWVPAFTGSVATFGHKVWYECTISPFKLTFQFKLVRPPFLLCLQVNATTELPRPNSKGLSEAAQDFVEAKCQQCSSQRHLWLVQVRTKFKDNNDSSLCLQTVHLPPPCFPAFTLNITVSSTVNVVAFTLIAILACIKKKVLFPS